MGSRDSTSGLMDVMRDAILQLCKSNIVYGGHIEVDGIICISGEEHGQQIVVKVHEKLYSSDNNSSTASATCKSEDPMEYSRQEAYVPLNYSESGEQEEEENESHNERLGKLHSSQEEEDVIIGQANDPGEGTSVREQGDNHQDTYRPTCVEELEEEEQLMETDQSESVPGIRRQAPTIMSGMLSYGATDSSHSKLRNLLTKAPLTKPHSVMPFLQRRPLFIGQTASTIPECKSCGFTFADTDLLKEHNEAVHGVFTCNYCFRTFTSRSNLDRHSRLHTGHKPYVCTICNKAFSRKDHLTNHAAKHAFKCGKCLKRFVDKEELRLHYVKDHNAVLTNICDHCNKGFTDPAIYADHRKTHPDLNDKGRPKFQGFMCKECSYTSGDRLQLLKHRQVHMTSQCFFNCLACRETFMDPVQYSHHFVGHKDHINVFECCICRQVCSTYTDLKQHEFGHLNAESELHVCPMCNKGFHGKHHLDQHIISHSVFKTHKCNTCSKVFSNSSDLKKHELTAKHGAGRRTLMKRKLEAQRILQVDKENESAHRQEEDEEEGEQTQETHNGEEEEDDENIIIVEPESPPESQEQDDKSFNQDFVITENPTPVIEVPDASTNTPSHSSPVEGSTHSSEGGSDWNPVGSVTTMNSSYSVPIPTGTYICSICCAQFPSFQEFEGHCFAEHYRHPCMYCEKTFAQKANRDRHVCIHTGEKPFACPECGEKFARGDKLKLHRQKGHNVEYPSPYSRSTVPAPQGSGDGSNASRESLDAVGESPEKSFRSKEEYIVGNNNNSLRTEMVSLIKGEQTTS